MKSISNQKHQSHRIKHTRSKVGCLTFLFKNTFHLKVLLFFSQDTIHLFQRWCQCSKHFSNPFLKTTCRVSAVNSSECPGWWWVFILGGWVWFRKTGRVIHRQLKQTVGYHLGSNVRCHYKQQDQFFCTARKFRVYAWAMRSWWSTDSSKVMTQGATLIWMVYLGVLQF